MDITLHLRIVGCFLLLLAGMNVIAPRQLGWIRDMKDVRLLTRQVFFVHLTFIAMIILMFGLVSLLFTDVLLNSGQLSFLVLSGMAVFWGVRTLFQIFIYDRSLWQGHTGKTIAHVLISALLGYFTAVYLFAALQVN